MNKYTEIRTIEYTPNQSLALYAMYNNADICDVNINICTFFIYRILQLHRRNRTTNFSMLCIVYNLSILSTYTISVQRPNHFGNFKISGKFTM